MGEKYKCPQPNRGDLTKEQEQLCHHYIKNDAKELNKVVIKLVKKFGVPKSEYDDYCSMATKELWIAAKKYDKTKCDNFHAYFVFRVKRKITQQFRDSIRFKRMPLEIIAHDDGKVEKIILRPKSLDAISDDTGKSLEEIIGKDNDDIEQLFNPREETEYALSDVMIKYLHSLTEKQRMILHMLERNIPIYEIKEILNLDDSKYNELWQDMTSFEKTKKLEYQYCVN